MRRASAAARTASRIVLPPKGSRTSAHATDRTLSATARSRVDIEWMRVSDPFPSEAMRSVCASVFVDRRLLTARRAARPLATPLLHEGDLARLGVDDGRRQRADLWTRVALECGARGVNGVLVVRDHHRDECK